MTSPCLSIDLDKIEHNARTIVALCAAHGIAVAGVTKATCGNPEVARAMLRGGVKAIADSRLQNIQRMRNASVETLFMLLRLPALSNVDEVIDSADLSLNSELATLEELSAAALQRGRIHDVMLMLDLGDLREGVWPDRLITLVKQAEQLAGIRIKGLGTNLACFSGVMPNRDNMNYLVDLAAEIEQIHPLRLQWLSGINSSGLNLLAAGKMPKRINHARIGEAILLGRETTQRNTWPNTYQDAFVLQAEVIELQKKPSVFLGNHCEDAFGKHPVFEDRGDILRALLNIGRQDIDIEAITPLDSHLTILGASSDYIAIDASAAAASISLGQTISFSLNYSALLAAMTSEYVKKYAFQGSLFDQGILHAVRRF